MSTEKKEKLIRRVKKLLKLNDSIKPQAKKYKINEERCQILFNLCHDNNDNFFLNQQLFNYKCYNESQKFAYKMLIRTKSFFFITFIFTKNFF